MARAIISFLACFSFVAPLTLAGCGHPPLGEKQMTFCRPFVDKVSKQMPMPYKDFIKFTDGEGQPSGLDITPDPYRHWDGMSGETHTSSLNVLIVHKDGQDWVKGGMVTCPNNKSIQFGVWE